MESTVVGGGAMVTVSEALSGAESAAFAADVVVALDWHRRQGAAAAPAYGCPYIPTLTPGAG